MYEGMTVKDFQDILQDMKSIYPFEDQETRLCTYNSNSRAHDTVEIVTTDKNTGVIISMCKYKKPLE